MKLKWILNHATSFSWRIVAILVCVGVFLVSYASADENRSPTVGAAGRIEQIILPGSELVGKPIVDGAPIVVRVVNVFPHGDSFRYDIQFHGMEPGEYNLVNWLERKDGGSVSDLPNIDVSVRSLLPPGQVEPNGLESGWIPRMGGYRILMIAAIALWVLGLLALIFAKRKTPMIEVIEEQQVTLADLLQQRIEAASANQMDPRQYAELERMLTAFWRRKLDLESVPTHIALEKIKAHSDAGPLMRQLETWMHSPVRSENVDLGELLKPFRSLPADVAEFENGTI